MAAPPWGLCELVILLNICDQRVGLQIKGPGRRIHDEDGRGSLRGAMSTLQLLRLRSFPVQQEGAQEIECTLSRDAKLICEFLGVPLQNVDKAQHESHEEVFEIVVNHRFFHISGMTTRLEELESHPTPNLAELQILREFMTWWINVKSKTNFKGPKCFTYDEVTQECLSFFMDHMQLYLTFQLYPERNSTPRSVADQVTELQEQDQDAPAQDNQAPQPDRSGSAEEQADESNIIRHRHLLRACACFSIFLSASIVVFVAFRKRTR